MILSNVAPTGSRAGIAQLALAAALFALSPFTSEWRLLATLELAIYFTLAGSALVVYASVKRDLPLRNLATTWLPLTDKSLVCFALLFGTGALIYEDGRTVSGAVLMALGYASLGIKSAFRLFSRAKREAGSAV